MARAVVVPIRPRPARYSPAIAAEAWMEIAESARRVLSFAEDELRTSFRSGDLGRLRTLQSVHRDAGRVVAEGRRMAAWADASCVDHVAAPGHGRAA